MEIKKCRFVLQIKIYKEGMEIKIFKKRIKKVTYVIVHFCGTETDLWLKIIYMYFEFGRFDFFFPK